MKVIHKRVKASIRKHLFLHSKMKTLPERVMKAASVITCIRELNQHLKGDNLILSLLLRKKRGVGNINLHQRGRTCGCGSLGLNEISFAADSLKLLSALKTK